MLHQVGQSNIAILFLNVTVILATIFFLNNYQQNISWNIDDDVFYWIPYKCGDFGFKSTNQSLLVPAMTYQTRICSIKSAGYFFNVVCAFFVCCSGLKFLECGGKLLFFLRIGHISYNFAHHKLYKYSS